MPLDRGIPETQDAVFNMPSRNTPDAASMVFIENMGQVNTDVLYYSSTGSMAFGDDSVFIYTSNAKLRNVLRLEFVGSNDAAPEAREPVDWKTNYFIGEENNWRTGVGGYEEIVYKNIWDSIDLVYYLQENGIKYDFIAKPGSDISDIKIRVSGHKQITMSKSGDLNLGTGLGGSGGIWDSGLSVFYADGSGKIDADFRLIEPDTYGFTLERPDPSRTIVIDPLIYSTLLGGSDFDHATDVWAGDDGCAYITGYTDSLDFITTPGSYDNQHEGATYDIFITKMALNGDSLVYSTLLGAVGEDRGNAIHVNSQGNAYITGITNSQDFPTTDGAYDRTYNGGAYDAFVTKLGPMGDYLVYSTLIGGERLDWSNSICVDNHGNAFITGEGRPTPPPGPPEARAISEPISIRGYPTTPGAISTQLGHGDVFVTKLGSDGNQLIYSALFGSVEHDVGKSIAVDKYGYAYVTGYTVSPKYPVSPSAFDRYHNGGLDSFVTKITPSGSAISYSTFLGGENSEMGHDITVGEWGHAYVTGYTRSQDFPVTDGAHSVIHSGNEDAFATVLGIYGDELVYSTFLGGENGDRGKSIYIDRKGMVVVAGNTYSPDFPVSDNAIDPTYNGRGDVFVTRLPLSGKEHFYSSYLGGNDTEQVAGIGAVPGGFTYVAGESYSSDFPITPGVLDGTHNGETDIFVTKLDLAAPYTNAGPDQTIMEGETLQLDGTGSHDNHIIVNYTWECFDGVENVTLFGTGPQHQFDVPGNYHVNLTVTDQTGNWDVDSLIVTVLDITPPNASAGPDIFTDEDINIALDGSDSTDNVGIVNYSWKFSHGGKDMVLYGPVRTFNFTEPGVYKVTLTVRDEAGNEDKDELTIRVNDITDPVADPGDDKRVFNNTLVYLDGTASYDNVGIEEYRWTLTGEGVETTLTGPSAVYLFDQVGEYGVTLNVTDAAGNWDTTDIKIHVMETIAPAANAGPDITTEEGVPTYFDATSSSDNVGIAEWLWSFNDGLNDVTISGERPTWTFRKTGTYTVMLNVTDAAGNWDTDTLTVTVLDTSPPVISPGPNKIGSVGQEIVFDGYTAEDSSGIDNITWTFTHNGTVVRLSGANPSYIFWSPGKYTINLTAEDPEGNAASATFEVMILQSYAHQEEGDDSIMWLSGIVFALGVCVLLLNRWRPRP